MAIYHQTDGQQRPETFPGPPEPRQPPRRSSGRDGGVVALAIAAAFIAGGAAFAWYWFKPEIQFSTPFEETLPFQQTASYAVRYDEIVNLVGPDPTVRTGERSALDWSVAGGGSAFVHLHLNGPEQELQVFAQWQRERDAWIVQTASYRVGEGEQVAIPLGAGSFMSRYDLAAWRAADPATRLGQGQRELLEGRPIQAIRQFSEVLENDRENTEALLWRGRSFEAIGNVPKALSDYQRILVVEPDNAAALARLDGLRASPGPGEELSPRPPVPPPPQPRIRPSELIPD